VTYADDLLYALSMSAMAFSFLGGVRDTEVVFGGWFGGPVDDFSGFLFVVVGVCNVACV